MSASFSINQIEAAINVWRDKESVPTHGGEALILGAKARLLADVYGLMIHDRKDSIAESELSPDQKEALITGLSIAEWKAARSVESHEPA